MTQAGFQVDEPQPKRRKVRKGTQSCWECRRRKVSCTLAASTNAVCDNCKRRGTACISQEHPMEILPSPDSSIESRLSRVEKVIENLTNTALATQIFNLSGKDFSKGHSSQFEPKPVAALTSNQCMGNSTLNRPKVDDIPNKDDCFRTRPASERPSSPNMTKPARDKYEDVSLALIAAWPSQRDIDLICTLPVGISAQLYGGIYRYSSGSRDEDPLSPQKILQLPAPGSHPVLIAHKLLVLGLFLQAIPPSSISDLVNMGTSYRHIMTRVIDSAITLVTSKEHLIDSVEGIECIMIEAMYHNYAGDLRRAWKAVRRATTVAQMMMLHHGPKSGSIKILQPETRESFSHYQLCFRLVQMDCYLSLMLGLPRASLEPHFATTTALHGCQPIDRMQRAHCLIAIRILQHNEHDISGINHIDKLLQNAAAEMPPKWWLVPKLGNNNSGTKDAHETIRLMNQVTHYHLLIRLHLPYMLRSSPDRKHDHSKITAVHASRETLARFIAFHTSIPTNFYCRGVDYLAVIATTVLCLAYIDSHRLSNSFVHNSNTGTDIHCLSHCRPNDRGTMEHTLDIFEFIASSGTDSIAVKLAFVIRHLLAIEASAASGNIYSTSSSISDMEELGCHGNLTSKGKGFRIHIPHIGTINLEQCSIAPITRTPAAPECSPPITLVTDMPNFEQLYENNQQLLLNSQYAVVPEFGSQLESYNSGSVESQCRQPATEEDPSLRNYISSLSNGNLQEEQFTFASGNTSDEDESGLCSVEVALFESLFNGTNVFSLEESEYCNN